MTTFLVLSNIPLTFSGGLIALFIAGQTLNVSSLIGLIALFCISLQNGIILIGRINGLCKQGLGLEEAVLQGALTRFRPTLMTELILILGVLPLILGSASGSDLHQPLAVVYIGGFLVAIFYEQFVLPVLYQLCDYWWKSSK
jgi:cobalt-zinc-cadmium resistance protein CzcA